MNKQQLNALQTVTHADIGDYRIWIGTYNPMDMYAQMLAACVAAVCAEAAGKLAAEDAERWMLDHVEGAAEIIEARKQGRLRPLTAPNELPIRGPTTFIEAPITHAIRESLSPGAGGRLPAQAGGIQLPPNRKGGCGC